MNARHAHDLIRIKFPVFVATEHEWTLLAHGDPGDATRIEAFLRRNFSENALVVRVTRKIGGLLSIQDAAAAIVAALGQAEVRVANRAFTEFAVIGHPGVGTAWKAKVELTTMASP